MGCNFYTLRGKHIGKRSAAGLYCWDCGVPLNREGESGVHKSHADNCTHKGLLSNYCCLSLKKCPKCGNKPKKEDFSNSAVGRELGFNKEPFAKKTGVASCSSFSWAMRPTRAKKLLFVKDEYGRKYSGKTFIEEILAECPIQFYDLIGQEFC